MDKLSVGIIGAGYWGPNLIRNFSACPATEVAGVCDANPQRLDGIRKNWGHLNLVSSVDELIGLKVQAVAIATPVSTHFPLAKRCLEAGLHVLVEKPLASTIQEAEALVALAEKHKRVLMVDHTYLFNNNVRMIKKVVDAGELGELYYVDSIRINLGLFQRDVNVIWDLAPHDLSIVDHVVAQDARSISAWGCAHTDSGIEDMAYVNVDYSDQMMVVSGQGTADDLRGVQEEPDLQRAQHHRTGQDLQPRDRARRDQRRGRAAAAAGGLSER
jgi:predicted dehydrogenase